MNWGVFTRLSPLEIQAHWVAALVAFALGLVIFSLKKGTRLHKALGWTYVAAMAITAGSAVLIREIGPSGATPSLFGFSPIHLFVPLTFFGIGGALIAIRNGDVKRHRARMIGVFFGALLIAGLFTFAPGRRVYMLLFGDPDEISAAVARRGG